ncbi:MAG: hypothetical protein ACK5Q5_14670 [Planctomycetaceae bacterium]
MTVDIPLLLADVRDNWVPAAVMGTGLVLLGGWFMKLHLQTWRRYAADPTIDDAEREHYRRQFRRRMQASGIILVIGLMVPIGDSLIPWRKQDASVATLYWLFVLGLTCWVLLLAMGDLVSTRAHSRASLSRLQRKQRELQEEADRLRQAARKTGNGTSH